jgi:putative membrane protein insertion efficiency factor
MKKLANNIFNIPKYLLISIIDIYQSILSPDHSWLKARFPHGYCRFYPSCSQYAKESIARFGFVKGLILSAKRLSRCHPWSEPQVDPVPHS